MGGGSSSTWAATTPTNWATTSGGLNNARDPGTADLAIFDSNSGTGNSIISASITVQGLDCTGGTGSYAGTITHDSGVTLTINTPGNSLRLAAGMTYAAVSNTASVVFTNTSGTSFLTSAGHALGQLTVNGVGGTCQQQDDLLVNASTNGNVIVTAGSLDCNGHALTTGFFQSSNANARTISLGTTLTLGGAVSNAVILISFANTTNLVFNLNSANIVILGPTSPINGFTLSLGTIIAYNNFTFSPTTIKCCMNIGFTSLSFNQLNIGAGWDITVASGTITVASAFTWTGTQSNPIGFNAGSPVATTISCPSGACSATWTSSNT